MKTTNLSTNKKKHEKRISFLLKRKLFGVFVLRKKKKREKKLDWFDGDPFLSFFFLFLLPHEKLFNALSFLFS